MSYKEAQAKAALIGVVCLILLIVWIGVAGNTEKESQRPAPQQEQVIIETNPTVTTTTTTTAKPTETTKGPYYPLTDWERDLVERVVMAEAGGEPYLGQKAVAQCILNASLLQRTTPAKVVTTLRYTKARPDPTESVKQAVSAVFDDGATVFDRDVVYFYAPKLATSTWHESQVYVVTIGCHRFFKEAR